LIQLYLILKGCISEAVIERSKKYWGVRQGILASCILYAGYENNCSMTKKEVCNMMEDINKGEYIFSDLIRGTELENVLKCTSDK
jgi:hypothetical protein